MEEKLGRKLLPGETVHHKNGVRDDNRPGNLELWVSTRSGQRVTDLVAFIVEYYRAEVEAALADAAAELEALAFAGPVKQYNPALGGVI